MFIDNFFHKTVILRKLFVFLFFFTFIKILVVSFSGDRHMGYWSYALLFCDRKGKLACTILYIYSGVWIHVLCQTNFRRKKLNRLYNTFIVINFIDTNIYYFIIWNLIYLIIHSVTMRLFVMQCPFEDDFPLSLHKKIMNDPVKFPEKYVWNSNYNIVLNQRLEISFPYMLGIFHINMHNICFIIMYIFIYYLTLIFDVVGLWFQKNSKILFWRCSIKIQKHE